MIPVFPKQKEVGQNGDLGVKCFVLLCQGGEGDKGAVFMSRLFGVFSALVLLFAGLFFVGFG